MMAYVESFARAMERARQSVSYWDRKTLDHLQAAHDAEMRQCSKSEYHRGFEDSKATRDADQWQLELQRKAVVARLQAVIPAALCGSHETLSAICKAVYEPVTGWTMGACESLRNRLIYLLGGETTNSDAEISAKVVQNGEKHQLATYDVLGNERHKAVCELKKMHLDTGSAIKKLAIALGIRWNAANASKSCAMIQSRLIHLLGGDQPTLSDLWGILDAPNATDFAGNRQNGPKSGEKQPEMQRDESKSRDSLQEVQSQSITGEQREYTDDYCYRGHFSAFKIMAYSMPWDNPAETSEDANGTASNNDGTCPIAVQSPSITDELRKFAETFRYEWYDVKDGSICYTTSDYPPSLDSIRISDYANGIADRIDAQFNRVCEQHESVLQQTISDTVNEYEREMAELRADYERATKLQRKYGEEVAELQSKYDRLSAICDDMTMTTRQYLDDTNELLSGHVTKGEDNG